MKTTINSWGNYPQPTKVSCLPIYWRNQADLFTASPVLPFGQGRSYGDSCLNKNGTLLLTSCLNRIIKFDRDLGILRCESGITLADILSLITPENWILPVMPGTQFVSLGGAIANDIHGKNHHHAGTFGCHVLQFELLRSDGRRLLCSRQENQDYFSATIGGLGLTGLITWAEIQLRKIPSAFLSVDTIPFTNLNAFFELSNASEISHEYTVSWIDTHHQRGLFSRANYLPEAKRAPLKQRTKNVPCFFPNFALNAHSMNLFNHLYFSLGKQKGTEKITHFQPFFFPLDGLLNWNRIYGKRGFLQYQCVVPLSNDAAIFKLVSLIKQSGLQSFLSVLKIFGGIKSPGLLSFPMPGITLALDFPFQGKKTLVLLEKLDEIVSLAEGRVYPAKDARMSSSSFKQFFPNWNQFSTYIDRHFSSSFWQRVTGETL